MKIAYKKSEYWLDPFMAAKRELVRSGQWYIPKTLRDKIEVFIDKRGRVCLRKKIV